MKKIPLTKGRFTVVDDDVFAILNQYTWQCSFHGYATRLDYETQKHIKMHRQIMNPPSGMMVDHINGDKLDNRRSNLRVCTAAENSRNQRVHSNNTSGFKGVHWDGSHKKWRALIKFEGKKFYAGRFSDVIDAARAYDAKARELFGQFARLNFPDQPTA